MEACVTNIQKYSIHDGSGIRTTVFFKGCPLRCRWCHNPETQNYRPQLMVYRERCSGCGRCVQICTQKAIVLTAEKDGRLTAKTDRNRCSGCGACTDRCLANAREVCGKNYTVRELVQELKKDVAFYETSGGGVTLSGGEVLSQNMEFVEALARALREHGISVYLDTCGAVPYENIRRIFAYTDVFLYDIKSMSEEVHKKYTGASNRQILDNLIRLNEQRGRIWLRIPVIAGVNDDRENIRALIDFLKEHHIVLEHIHLLPYHTVGIDKYDRLEQTAGERMEVPAEETLAQWKKLLEKAGFTHIYIGG